MAAARVFDIPELLEQILLQLAAHPRKTTVTIVHPVYQLYVLQSVDCTFRNAIQSSKWLQQSMVPVCVDKTRIPRKDLPWLHWLAQSTGLCVHISWAHYLTEDASIFGLQLGRSNGGSNLAQHFARSVKPSFRHPSASWPKMLVSSTNEGKRLRIGLRVAGPPLNIYSYLAIWEWKQGPTTTLGEVYDKYSELCAFSLEEHLDYRTKHSGRVQVVDTMGEREVEEKM